VVVIPINTKKSNFSPRKSCLIVGLVHMVINKYKYFRVRFFLIFMLFTCVLSCNVVKDALIVGEEQFDVPVSSQIDSISSESIFYFGVISKDGIDRFEKDVFQELLFDINAKKNTLYPNKELYKLTKSLERRPFKLVYVLDAYLVDIEEAEKLRKKSKIENKKKIAEIVFNPVSTDSVSSNNASESKNAQVVALTTLLRLKEKAQSQREAVDQGTKVYIVSCVKVGRGDPKTYRKYLEKRSGLVVDFYTTPGWNRFYVTSEYEYKTVKESFPDAWPCEYGK
jgi:hypothetical protein